MRVSLQNLVMPIALAALVAAVAPAEPPPALDARIDRAGGDIAAAAADAAAAREIALAAVESTMELQDGAEARLLEALRRGGRADVRAARVALDQANRDVGEACRAAEAVADRARQAASALAAARELLAAARGNDDVDSAKLLARFEELRAIALKAAQEAEDLAGESAVRWLTRVTRTTTTPTTTTTTTQPPSPSPVGRR